MQRDGMHYTPSGRAPRVVRTLLVGDEPRDVVLIDPYREFLVPDVALPMLFEALPGLAGIVAHLYALLPFISLAGLAIFPLTVAESLIFGLPVLVLGAWGTALGAEVTLAGYVGKVWLLLLIFGFGALAGAMQLRYMMALVSRASQDPLTGAFTRRSGGEIIDLQYRLSERHDTPFAVAFFDLDNFKSINDVYGHEEGDAALRGLVANLRHKLRRGDVVIRWGGEEFVVIPSPTGRSASGTAPRPARAIITRRRPNWSPSAPLAGWASAPTAGR